MTTPTMEALREAQDSDKAQRDRICGSVLCGLLELRKRWPEYADLVIGESYRLSLEDAKEHEEIEPMERWAR